MDNKIIIAAQSNSPLETQDNSDQKEISKHQEKENTEKSEDTEKKEKIKRPLVQHRVRNIPDVAQVVNQWPQFSGGGDAFLGYLKKLGKDMVDQLPICQCRTCSRSQTQRTTINGRYQSSTQQNTRGHAAVEKVVHAQGCDDLHSKQTEDKT